MAAPRKISSFGAGEIATDGFRDALTQTVDMLARAIQAQSQQVTHLV